MGIAEIIALLEEMLKLLAADELNQASASWREQRDKVVEKAKDFLDTQSESPGK